ncbi:unnamed protein product [Sphagnum jensenii]|uniref:CHAT domain-containing protein n=1 Tax=Sphagnum jensenii TaxID=128206 RepID=A0ABP1BTX6_9BRYO
MDLCERAGRVDDKYRARIERQVVSWDHACKLSEVEVGVECQESFSRARAAMAKKDWAVGVAELKRCRELVKATETRLPNEAVECGESFPAAEAATAQQDCAVSEAERKRCHEVVEGRGRGFSPSEDSRRWLLGFADLMMASLYAFRLKKFAKATTIALRCVSECQGLSSPADLTQNAVQITEDAMYQFASSSDCEDPLEEQLQILRVLTSGMHRLPSSSAPSKGHPERVAEEPQDIVGYKEFVKREVIRQVVGACEPEQVENAEYSMCLHLLDEYHMRLNSEERLRWAEECGRVFKERHKGVPSYIHQVQQVSDLLILDPNRALDILEEMRKHVDAKRWEEDQSGDWEAAGWTAKSAEEVQYMRVVCYQVMQQILDVEGKTADVKRYAQYEKKLAVGREHFGERIGELYDQAWTYINNEELEKAVACLEKCLQLWKHPDDDNIRSPEGFLDGRAYDWCLRKVIDLHTEMYCRSCKEGSPKECYFQNAMQWTDRYELEAEGIEEMVGNIFANKERMKLYHVRNLCLRERTWGDAYVLNLVEDSRMLECGRAVSKGLRTCLYDWTYHTDQWITQLEDLKFVYYALQCYCAGKSASLRLQLKQFNPDKTGGNLVQSRILVQEAALASNEALVWAERACTNALLLQLGRGKLPHIMKELDEFAENDEAAFELLLSSRAACGPATTVLEYYYSTSDGFYFTLIIYAMTRGDEVLSSAPSLFPTSFEVDLKKKLENLRTYFSQGSQTTDDKGVETLKDYGEDAMNADLEFLYDLLIAHVEPILDDMKPDDKLIIVAPELLSNVPFAALRKPNSAVGKGYLIQRHTISVAPSLRVLQQCQKRWEELVHDRLDDTKPGAIVAVGDAAYGNCHSSLKASAKEVNFIEELFGKKHVVKLMGTEANPSEVLKLAKHPSENGCKQAIIHIASHCIGQKGTVRRGAITLTRPERRTSLTIQDDEVCDNEDGCDEIEEGQMSPKSAVPDTHAEVAQMPRFGELGGMRGGVVVPISRDSGTMKSENISGCGFEWRSHIVTLSGCESYNGEIKAEGVLNLPRHLMIAGVPCVVVSQWKVFDSSTCDLMKGFYQKLREGEDVSSALCAAMLEMHEAKHKVHEWAPFVVCGLPTVRLPWELQAGDSTRMSHDLET